MALPALWLAALAFLVLPASAQTMQSAEVSLDRHFQLQELLPAEGQYVSYTATVKNTGSTEMAGMRLWVAFGPASSRESASFAIPDLQAGESKQLTIGPFKMTRSGEHLLYVGINRSGVAFEPNDVDMNYSPATPADSITAYSTGLITAVSAGAALVVAGGALVVLYIKKTRQ